MNALELRSQRPVVRVAMVVLVALVAAAGSQGQIIFSSSVYVSHAPGGGPQVATDQNGHIYVLWLQVVSGTAAPEVYISRSTDGGASFSAGIDLSSGVSATAREWPAVSVDASGKIDVIWLNENQVRSAPLVTDLYFARSIDGGASFNRLTFLRRVRQNRPQRPHSCWAPTET